MIERVGGALRFSSSVVLNRQIGVTPPGVTPFTCQLSSLSDLGPCGYCSDRRWAGLVRLGPALAHHSRYQTRSAARQDIFHYIEVFYNRKRRHSALGYLSPAQFQQSLELCPNWVSTKWGEPQAPLNR